MYVQFVYHVLCVLRFLKFYLFIYLLFRFWSLFIWIISVFVWFDLCICLMQVQEGTLIYSSHYGGQEWSQVRLCFLSFYSGCEFSPLSVWSYFSFSFLSCKISGWFHLYKHPLTNDRAYIYIYRGREREIWWKSFVSCKRKL